MNGNILHFIAMPGLPPGGDIEPGVPMFRRTLLAVSLALVSSAAFAQTALPGVDARQQNQDRRIDQGIATGSLTAREAGRLEAGQARIDRMEGRVLADGTVTGRERARLDQAQDVQSRHIWRQKHDRQHDFNHNGRVDRPRR
jgi:hypothetical protein